MAISTFYSFEEIWICLYMDNWFVFPSHFILLVLNLHFNWLPRQFPLNYLSNFCNLLTVLRLLIRDNWLCYSITNRQLEKKMYIGSILLLLNFYFDTIFALWKCMQWSNSILCNIFLGTNFDQPIMVLSVHSLCIKKERDMSSYFIRFKSYYQVSHYSISKKDLNFKKRQ